MNVEPPDSLASHLSPTDPIDRILLLDWTHLKVSRRRGLLVEKARQCSEWLLQRRKKNRSLITACRKLCSSLEMMKPNFWCQNGGLYESCKQKSYHQHCSNHQLYTYRKLFPFAHTRWFPRESLFPSFFAHTFARCELPQFDPSVRSA